MNKRELQKLVYVCPTIEVIYALFDNELMEASFRNNGGHEKVGDEGTEFNTKQGFFIEEDEEEEHVPLQWNI